MSLEEPIAKLVNENVYTISEKSSVIEAASAMVAKNVSCLVVSGGTGTAGIVTERDILRKVTAIGADPKNVIVKDIMSTNLIVATPITTIGDAAKKMIDNKIKRLVIVGEDGQLSGLITMTDLIRWMAKQEELSDSLINYLTYHVP